MGARDQPKETKEEKKKERFVISEVPTQTRPVIVDTKINQAYDELTMLCKIANDIEEIKNQNN